MELSGNKRLQDEVVGQERRLIELTTTDDLMSCCGKSDSNGLFDPHLFNIPLTGKKYKSTSYSSLRKRRLYFFGAMLKKLHQDFIQN